MTWTQTRLSATSALPVVFFTWVSGCSYTIMLSSRWRRNRSSLLVGPCQDPSSLICSLLEGKQEKKCQRCIASHPQPATLKLKKKKKKSRLINSALQRVCTLALPNGKTFSRPRRSSRRPPPLPHHHFLRLPPRVAEESCNYCTSVTVETTAQQSGFEHR